MKKIIPFAVFILFVSCSKMTDPIGPSHSSIAAPAGHRQNQMLASAELSLNCITAEQSQQMTANTIIEVFRHQKTGLISGQFRTQITDKKQNKIREIVAQVKQYHAQNGACCILAIVSYDSRGCDAGPFYRNHGKVCPYRQECLGSGDCPKNNGDCRNNQHSHDDCQFTCHDWCCMGECCNCQCCNGDPDDCLHLTCQKRNGKGKNRKSMHQCAHTMPCRVGQLLCIQMCDGRTCTGEQKQIKWRWCTSEEQSFVFTNREQWTLCQKEILNGDININMAN